MRDYKVRKNENVYHEHSTGRLCDDERCGGELNDSIINFGEGLDPGILEKANKVGMASDLMLCMGTSMRVVPACSIPMATKLSGGRLVICNL